MALRILNKIRLARTRKPSSVYERTLGVTVKDARLFEMAFTHVSARSKADKRDYDNERLEYLGDAVIESVVSHYLYACYPDKREGFLTETRSKIVCRHFLNETALQLGMNRLLHVSDVVRQNSEDIYGNAFEAVVGAIYLDSGYETARAFIHTHLLESIDLDTIAKTTVNFKSRLLEWCQQRDLSLDYACERRMRPSDNQQAFYCTLSINGHRMSEAWGVNKKEAEQLAARYTLNELSAHPRLERKIKTPTDDATDEQT